ncbi:MAG: hypothetical protein ACOX52_03010 [Verrucomicrobiota bacterium]
MRSRPSISSGHVPPLALLASWRFNFPAFTHDDDGIECSWTVYRRLGSDIDPTHAHNQLEKATAPSAGNSPDGHGESRMEKRRPFRTASY